MVWMLICTDSLSARHVAFRAARLLPSKLPVGIVEAVTPEEAARALRAAPFDLVLTSSDQVDTRATRRLRKRLRRAGTPIITFDARESSAGLAAQILSCPQVSSAFLDAR